MAKLLIFLILLTVSFAFLHLKPIDLQSIQKKYIQVTVVGQIQQEGEYTLPIYSTFKDLLSHLDLKDNADISMYNPNLILLDKDYIEIPIKVKQERININTSSLEELTTIPGISETMAKRIIEYRNEQLFSSIEEIMNVKGIKESRFQKIKDYIRI